MAFAPLCLVVLATTAASSAPFSVGDDVGLTLTIDHPEATRCVLTVGRPDVPAPAGCAGLDLASFSRSLERLPHRVTRMVWLRHEDWSLGFAIMHVRKDHAEELSAEAIDAITIATEGTVTAEGRVGHVRAESAPGRRWELVEFGGRPAAHFVATVDAADGQLWTSVYMVPAPGELVQLNFFAPAEQVGLARPTVASIVGSARLPPASYPAFGKPESAWAKLRRPATWALVDIGLYVVLAATAVGGGLWLRASRRRHITLSGHVATTLAPEVLVGKLRAHDIAARSGHFSNGDEWVMVEPDLMLLERDGRYEVSGASSDAGLRAATALATALRAEKIGYRFERRRGGTESLGVDEHVIEPSA